MQQIQEHFPQARRVFIATDDTYIFFDTRFNEEYKAAGFEFLYVMDRKFKRTDSEKFRALLCDIWILSECDHLVAAMTSNFARLAWELMYSKNPRAKMVSLQSQWWPTP
jgi:hypothetical protein